MLAAGGIGWSSELRNRLFPDGTQRYSMSPDSNTGDGILAGERAHGEIAQDVRSPALWMPSSVMPQEDGHVSVFPHIMLDRAKPGLIAVNRSGVRFVNEANSYHDFVEGMLRSHQTVPSIPSYLICDRSFVRDYGLGLIHPGTRDLSRFIKSGYLFQGDSIAKLAQAIGVDGDALAGTIERHNRFAGTGVDEDFGRGTSELNRFNGDPANKPNPCLRKIGPGPVFRGRSLALRPREQRGLAHRCQWPRADIRTAADPRPLCRRCRRRLDFPRHLSRARHHDRPGHGVCMARGDGYRGQVEPAGPYLIGGRGSTASPASIR